MEYKAEDLHMESLDEFTERMIKQYPESKEYWESRRDLIKDIKEKSRNTTVPEGYVKGIMLY